MLEDEGVIGRAIDHFSLALADSLGQHFIVELVQAVCEQM